MLNITIRVDYISEDKIHFFAITHHYLSKYTLLFPKYVNLKKYRS